MRVYVAGPYTGDQALNVRNAILAGDRLLKAGHQPYIPHLCHFWHMIAPRPYDNWMALDLLWLEQCEALILLKGRSPGAEIEVEYAERHGIDVYYEGVEAFLDRF